MRYSVGVVAALNRLPDIGEVQLAVAVGKKDWRKYAIHYLEGLFSLLGDRKVAGVTHVSKHAGRDVVYIEFECGILATVHVFMDIAPGGELNVYGTAGNLSVDHGGAYKSFRNTIEHVIAGFQEGCPCIDFDKTRNIIRALIAGQESLEWEGKRIELR